ncbi:MAG: TIGR00730 family Rossman fold protein [Clostridia bacterium]|nr:TIGR00730 family Rossman fold protein [Clostridia bacterium]
MKITMYGSSSDRIPATYLDGARRFGEMLAKRGHTLCFGAGNEGVMGAAARGAKESGGTVIGILPDFFPDGIEYPECTSLLYTDSMRERKRMLESEADAFAVLPGGVGTFDELFETYALRVLDCHRKPIVVYNIGGWFDPMKEVLDHSEREEFLLRNWREDLFVSDDLSRIFEYLESDAAIRPDAN